MIVDPEYNNPYIGHWETHNITDNAPGPYTLVQTSDYVNLTSGIAITQARFSANPDPNVIYNCYFYFATKESDSKNGLYTYCSSNPKALYNSDPTLITYSSVRYQIKPAVAASLDQGVVAVAIQPVNTFIKVWISNALGDYNLVESAPVFLANFDFGFAYFACRTPPQWVFAYNVVPAPEQNSPFISYSSSGADVNNSVWTYTFQYAASYYPIATALFANNNCAESGTNLGVYVYPNQLNMFVEGTIY